ncbi:MAG: DUF2938 family protein [Burkholderiaceae bacterium]
MAEIIEIALQASVIGIGATVILDLWIAAGSRFLGISGPNWAMVGRWVGHMQSGCFTHESIGAASPIRGELALGWIVHYVTGIAYGLILVALWGDGWLRQPTMLPPMLLLWAFLVAPYFVMMPGMGQGILASKALKPNLERLKSVIGHSVFGVGMYLTALLIKGIVA